MSNSGKFWDNTPFIPMAGVTTAIEGDSADASIRPDLYTTASTVTPDNIKKFRDSTKQRVGVKQLHYGIYDDPKDYENLVHVIKTLESDHVPDCIKGLNLDGNKYFMNQLNESNYASNKREPLGKSIVRNYNFPEEVKNPGFRFGVPTKGFFSAKDVIYNGCLLNEPDDVKKLYYKTHGLTDPGEQSKRGFVFPFDENDHAFGFFQPKEFDGAKKSLRTDFLYNPYPATKLVPKRLEDFRTANDDMLGKGKYHGTLNPKFQDEDHTFGVKSKLGDAWNVGRCIHGDHTTVTPLSVSPDVDLGRDYHYACKLKNLQPIERDPNKVYGVPTIRSDLKPKEVKSVCDLNNYGDEPDVYELLYPHPENVRGVHDEDFDVLYTKDEIYKLLRKYDFIIPEDEYNLIYQVGLKNYPNSEEKMSPKSFVATLRNLKREYQKYRTLVNNEC